MIKEKDSPTWTKRKFKTDSEIYKSHFTYNRRFIPLLGLGLKSVRESQRHKHGVHLEVTDYEAGRWLEPLPDPDFLHPHQEQAHPVQLGATFFETFAFEKLEIEEEKEVVAPNSRAKSLYGREDLCPSSHLLQTLEVSSFDLQRVFSDDLLETGEIFSSPLRDLYSRFLFEP